MSAWLSNIPRGRLRLLMVALTLGPLALLAYLSLTVSTDVVRDREKNALKAQASLSASYIQREMEGLGEIAESYAGRPALVKSMSRLPLTRAATANIRLHLTQIRGVRRGIGVAFVTSPGGRLLDIVPETPAIVGENFKFRDWYRGTTRGAKTYVSEAYVTQAEGNPNVVAVGTPIRPLTGPRATAVGILVVAYDVKHIQRSANRFARDSDVELTVTDQRGQVLAAPEALPEGLESRREDARVAAALAGRSGAGENERAGQPVLSAHTAVPGIGWTVIAETPRDKAFAGVHSLRATVLPITAGLALVLLGGVFLLDVAVRQRQQARDEALTASRMKSEFLANMSHEIRTPLNVVVGMNELLLDSDLDERQREYAETVASSSDALLTVLNDILDFSKIEAGKVEIEEADFALGDTVAEVCELLAGPAHAKDLELALSVEEGVPEMVRGDSGRVRQVLTNLLSNAIKFTSKGEVVVKVSAATEDEGWTIRFDVSDTGIGIAAEALPRLFVSFTQADSSTTRKFGGTGLGLAISKELSTLMGGEIGAESEVGKGSDFWFTVRVRPPALGPRAAGEPLPELRGLRVLVVDDNATNRQILERRLEGWDMVPYSTSGGREALELLLAQGDEPGIELALLDMNMPDMDGIDLARAIKAEPALRHLPLLLLTSSDATLGSAEPAIFDSLRKPVRAAKLYAAMAVAMQGRGAQPEAPKRVAGKRPHEPAGATHDRSILLVEDNAVNQRVASLMIEKQGFRTEIAANGLQALEVLAGNEYAAILMDCQMPEMDGYEATAEIRRLEGSGHHTAIIAMTANAMDGDREKCLAAGMDDYLSKPLSSDALGAALERWTASQPAA
ncbi:MAG TPA: response regulator [Thermoleophilaceae bacterium]|nr:response regulator [Thermoleophilaceae bacterium]